MPRRKRRLPVQKTYKLFIGGKFARGENGRVFAARDGHGNLLANYSRASRKDFRDAVRAARIAIPGWTKYSPYLRGQILFRSAEMLEACRLELESELARVDRSRPEACREVTAAIDRLVYYAGWTDKFSQILGSVNPVASSHFASDMDVNAIVDASGDDKIGEELQAASAINVKHYVRRSVANYFVSRRGKFVLDS